MVAVTKSKKEVSVPTSEVCNCFHLKRDAYYKYLRRFQIQVSKTSQVVKMVQKERKSQPRVGVRKLHKDLSEAFIRSNLKIGRDRLFDILREHDMLVKRKKASCRTTDSYHRFHKYNNFIKEMEISAPNQVWVSDITYIRTIKGFRYLAVITDLYSRKIIGHHLSDSL